jgi:xanthine/uracil permease
LVAMHVVAIAVYQWGLKVNLVGPMVHGTALLEEANPAARPGSNVLAAILLAVMAGFVYWLVVVFPRQP